MVAKPVAVAFGQVLREFRERADLSQEQVADATGLDRTYISMLERGTRQPTLDTLFRLANALDVAASTLVNKTAGKLS